LETVQRDFAPKGVDFYYIYKPLAHPEYNNYVAPVTIEERLMHVAEAKRRLGSRVAWLADTMDNVFHEAMGGTPNSELVIDPDGVIVARRAWSSPAALRADLERLVGPVENPTLIADLDLPDLPPPPTVTKGVVPRLERPQGMWPILIKPVLEENNDTPFYAKLRAEGDPRLMNSGSGNMYLGFHLDPLYRVHWNNEAGPVQFRINPPEGVFVTPASGVGPDVEIPADADPREFLISVTGEQTGETLGVDVFYFACDDALTFCIPVNQSYEITLARDESHDWSIQTSADNRPMTDAGPARALPNFGRLDLNGDGALTADELPEQMRARFNQMDSNGDGAISESEMPQGGRRRGGRL
jgi:hypothetical protein